jgi:pimeloyl-ACP methyl ester carboxylesterase
VSSNDKSRPLRLSASDLADAHLTDKYHPTTAAATAELSRLAYADEAGWNGHCTEAGWTYAKLLHGGTCQVGVCGGPEAIVFAARGSSEGGDWRDDFAITRVRWRNIIPRSGGQITRGFRRHVNQLLPELRDALHALRSRWPAAPLYVTGHSLGGAAAVLMAVAFLAQERELATAVYAHEMPRVGNRRFQAWYGSVGLGSRTFRTVVYADGRRDLITRVPPSGWPFRYRHVGTAEVLYHDPATGKIERIEGIEAWQNYRALNEVSYRAAWRVISNLRAGRAAHAITVVEDATWIDMPEGELR